MSTPQDYLRLVAGRLPGSVLPMDGIRSLLRLASGWPASREYLLECRLGQRPGPVDLSMAYRSRREHDALTRWLIARGVRSRERDWIESIRSIVDSCPDPQSADADPVTLWLELDASANSDTLEPPSVFFRFQPHCNPFSPEGDRDPVALRGQLPGSMANLCHRLWPSLGANVERLLSILPESASIGHVGMMWPRDPALLRITIGGLDPDSIRRLAGGPRGLPADDWLGHLAHLPELVAVACVDLHAGTEPVVSGLELFPHTRGHGRHCWRRSFVELERKGLCTGVQGEELSTWEERVTPLDSAMPWPEDALIESLHRPPNEFSLLRAGLNHLKLVMTPEGDIRAKAYLRIAHEWARFVEAPGEP